MSTPFPDYAFPSTIIVNLCEDDINVEGGANPIPGDSYSFPCSMQVTNTKYEVRNHIGVSVTYKLVYFQTNPNLTLPRKIRAGDQLTDEDGNVFWALGPIEDRGKSGLFWLVRCRFIHS